VIELYQHELCGACSRVRRKLTDLGLDWISRTVSPSISKRERVVELTGQPLVPVLVDPDNRMVVTESHDICAYLDEIYGTATI
jgi:glutathione S-transferase